MSEYCVRGIPSMMVERFWPFAEPYVKRALDHSAGELSADDLRRFCMDQQAQLFLISDGNRVVGAAVTEVVTYPRKKHLCCLALAGSRFEEWVELAHGHMERWGREMGCDALECHVRRGFVPKMEKLGFKHFYSVMVQKLNVTAPQVEEVGNGQGK